MFTKVMVMAWTAPIINSYIYNEGRDTEDHATTVRTDGGPQICHDLRACPSPFSATQGMQNPQIV